MSKENAKKSSSLTLLENEKLLQRIDSPNFTLYNCIELLCRCSNNIGIHYYLCQRLLTFPHAELQFYIPQLVQILLTIETESMALEDLIMKLKNENPHFALLTFWQLQALLTDLSTDPASYGFQVARRVLNNLQASLFNTTITEDDVKPTKMHENIAPALVSVSMMMSSIAIPQLSEMTKPLVESQGKRQKSYVFKVARNAIKDFTRNITLKNTGRNRSSSSEHSTRTRTKNKTQTENTFIRPSSSVDIVDSTMTKEDMAFKKHKDTEEHSLDFDMIDDVGSQVFEDRISSSIKMPKRKSKMLDNSFVHRTYDERSITDITKSVQHNPNFDALTSHEEINESPLQNYDQFTNSMPDLHRPTRTSTSFSQRRPITRTNTQPTRHNGSNSMRPSINGRSPSLLDISKISTTKKIKLLKSNYFRCETQFAIALESISQRLAQVPTEARLSSLRAELSLMNRDLPAEVDIPTLLPPNKKGKLHKLVVITANEAQVLNSAEKVPYLLFIEYLRDEFDFDPTTDENENFLKHGANKGNLLFDLNYLSNKNSSKDDLITLVPTFNESNGRTGSNLSYVVSDLDNDNDDTSILRTPSDVSLAESISSTNNNNNNNNTNYDNNNNNNNNGNNTFSMNASKEMDLGDMSMIRVKNQTDAEAFRTSVVLKSAAKVPIIPRDSQDRNPALKFSNNFDALITNKRSTSKEFHTQTDELADQMRISALMLNQLENSPQEYSATTNQIRDEIIASMKEVQDKFGYNDLEAIHGAAGERKLKNDLLTGGIDTSYLGEDWNTKKERIRKTSEYGHLENWDLCSVIAKSGDDLRQEAFACQMIQAMAQIWAKEKVNVWVKKMKILITSATTGLVETITNAVSVHSIKKSLTKKMVSDGELDEKTGIATLKDHYVRAFGDPNGFKFKRAQDNFASSLAAYSVICYLLQVKDRHNGNIMIDNEGHVVHIDFGFMLSNSPGSVGFEAAPFKLTYEYVELLGGVEGAPYKKFVNSTKAAYRALRKYSDQIVSMCEIMQKDNMQPCFQAGEQTSVQLEQRFYLHIPDEEIDDFAENFLIGKSLGSIYTRGYDQFQLLTQGIYS
ncbi:1-phosphatidylinositol 4-kinase NDAI_0F04180 [Naumovozyma dairenensis CBS 421]|uniref:1-phosphatidylinositol 4-kinase n=1 Tax=Naumovozyma dairenensis (strain ATCC 10597 / BCRC 20456 / CBS 421 / NBRC 0211 / NRRL Y-12639) TaxID=1071378 RepID=G0WD75_NAUDC|nr:hypothetical protein NDAI_0F04180 [Naumovozyma dairenensis CBS 421]CCD25736.1 hypothetical protein NDAI_0F04180 [Naumovozyma dairenensis CBS 421]